jgi:hypothetical protein
MPEIHADPFELKELRADERPAPAHTQERHSFRLST